MGGEEQDTHREVLASFLLSRAMANGSVYFVTEAKGFVWSLHGTPAALLSCFFGIDCTVTKRGNDSAKEANKYNYKKAA